MTIRIELTNPAEHQPSELRALAVLFNNLAEDRESGRIAGVDFPTMVHAPIPKPAPVAPKEVAAAPTPLPPTPEDIPAAPSASAPIAPPPAPAADVPPAPPTLTGVELDSAGLPWDGRIHAESKGKIGNGTWRKKKNLDPALVAEVEARLRELTAIPAAPAEVPPAPSAPITMPSAVEVPPAPPAAVPPAPAAPAAPVTIADVFKFTTAAEKAGTLNAEARATALASLGFKSMVEIGSRPDMAAQIIETFKQFGAE